MHRRAQGFDPTVPAVRAEAQIRPNVALGNRAVDVFTGQDAGCQCLFEVAVPEVSGGVVFEFPGLPVKIGVMDQARFGVVGIERIPGRGQLRNRNWMFG